jgi:sialidase-1
MAFEIGDGRLGLTLRARGVKRRTIAWSEDGGETWSRPKLVEALVGPTCQASVLALWPAGHGKSPRVLFANPASTKRERMTLRLSADGGRTWTNGHVIHVGPAGYSDLTMLNASTVGCLYEAGEKHPYERIVLARIAVTSLLADHTALDETRSNQ